MLCTLARAPKKNTKEQNESQLRGTLAIEGPERLCPRGVQIAAKSREVRSGANDERNEPNGVRNGKRCIKLGSGQAWALTQRTVEQPIEIPTSNFAQMNLGVSKLNSCCQRSLRKEGHVPIATELEQQIVLDGTGQRNQRQEEENDESG